MHLLTNLTIITWFWYCLWNRVLYNLSTVDFIAILTTFQRIIANLQHNMRANRLLCPCCLGMIYPGWHSNIAGTSLMLTHKLLSWSWIRFTLPCYLINLLVLIKHLCTFFHYIFTVFLILSVCYPNFPFYIKLSMFVMISYWKQASFMPHHTINETCHPGFGNPTLFLCRNTHFSWNPWISILNVF